MPQGDNRGGMWSRLLVGSICGLWLWMFMSPLQGLGLLLDRWTLWPIFGALVVAQAVPWRSLRVGTAFVVTTLYMDAWFRPRGLNLLAGVSWLLRTDGRRIVALLESHGLANPLQTHLFVAGLCLVFWLLVYAATRPRLWLFYNFLGILVLALIDGNTKVQPDGSLVVVTLLCLLMLGYTQFRRLRPHLMAAGHPVLRFFVPLAIVMVLGSGVAYAMPKAAAAWPNPFKSLENGEGGGLARIGGEGGTRFVGYQSDNARLGGSFVMNHTPVLSVVEPFPVYLRGQVFTEYTGKGWINGVNADEDFPVGQPYRLDSDAVVTGVTRKRISQVITVLSGQLHADVVFGGYQLDEVKSVSGSTSVGVTTLNPATDAAHFPVTMQSGQQWTVRSLVPEDPTERLLQLPPLPSNHAAAFPASVLEDLQLPSSLPAQVGQLAHTLTAGQNLEYTIVESIINYLQTNYQYQTQGVPVPGPGQDYVDQFLFQSKVGYCNNFSSAAAVLLRTQGIPTRWVTGFTAGQLDTNYKGAGQRYIVTEADAHSWMEVYFPSVGWIPFDPTPGFSEQFAPSPAQPGITQPPAPSQPTTHTQLPQVKPQSTTRSAATGSGVWTFVWTWLPRFAAAAAAALLLLGLIFRRRVRLWRNLVTWRRPTAGAMASGVRQLFRLLGSYGMVQKSGTTLRDLQPLADRFQIDADDYLQLVRTAEQAWYGGQRPTQRDLRQARRTWRRWVRNIVWWR